MPAHVSVASLAVLGILAFPQPSAITAQEGPVSSAPAEASAWQTLREGIADHDAVHRQTTLAAMASIGPAAEAVRLVVGCLKDHDTLVRQSAAAVLGQMGSEQAIVALKAALDDGPEVSFTAAKALWDLGDTAGRDIFQQVLEGERKGPGRLNGAIRDAKKKLKPAQLAFMGVKEAAGVLGPAGSLSVLAVREAMKEAKDSGVPGRSVAAEVLGKDSDPYALTLLEWALDDGNWAVRLSVAKALGERGNAGSIPKLAPLLTDDRHAVRYMAAASIIKLGLKNQSAGISSK